REREYIIVLTHEHYGFAFVVTEHRLVVYELAEFSPRFEIGSRQGLLFGQFIAPFSVVGPGRVRVTAVPSPPANRDGRFGANIRWVGPPLVVRQPYVAFNVRLRHLRTCVASIRRSDSLSTEPDRFAR